MIQRHGLKVRGLEFRLYYPKPRSIESVAIAKHAENRITFRPHFYFGETNQEIDFVFFLNGLPVVALELKHEKNQNVHDAVAQFAARDHTRKIFQHPFLYLAAGYRRRHGGKRPAQDGELPLAQHRPNEFATDCRRIPGGVSLPRGVIEG